VLLIFDGSCGFCVRAVAWMRRHDRAGRIRVLPSEVPGLLQQIGLSPDEAGRAVWAVTGRDERCSGAAAINRVLAELKPWPWPLAARLYTVPPIRWVEDRAYAWIASHRGWISSFAGARRCN